MLLGLGGLTSGAVATRSAWPAIREVGGSRLSSCVFVSSDGDDVNLGRTPDSPLRSIPAALARLGEGGGTVVLAPDDAVPVHDTIRLDVSRQRLVGDRTVIDGRQLGDQPLIELFSSMPQPLIQPWVPLESLHLLGPGRGSAATGLKVHTDRSEQKAAVAHIQVRNIAIQEFGVGILFGDNAYCITFDGCVVAKVATCVLVPEGVVNTGERLEFLACTLFDSDQGIVARSKGVEIALVGSSLDYCTTLVRADEGRVSLIGSHVEFDKARDEPPLRCSGQTGGITMIGGKLSATTKSGTAVQTPFIIANDSDPVAMSTFTNVWMVNLSTASGNFSGGDGFTQISGESTNEAPHRSFTVVGDTNNLLADGEFEQDSLIDMWFSESLTADLRVGDPRIVATSTRSRRERRAIEFSAQGEITSRQDVLLAVPMPRSSIPRARLDYRLGGAGSVVRVGFEAAVVRDGGHPTVATARSLGEPILLEQGTSGDWERLRSPLPVKRLPSWATHLVIRFSVESMSRGAALALASVNVCAT